MVYNKWGLPNDESYLILQAQSESMLSDLLRSGLPNDNPHLILQTQSESMLSDLLRSGLLSGVARGVMGAVRPGRYFLGGRQN